MIILQKIAQQKTEKETDQIQHMFYLDEEQTSLTMLATDTYDSLNHIGSLEEIKSEHLIIECKNDPTTFLPLSANIGGQLKPNKKKKLDI